MLLDKIISFTLGAIFLLVLACDGPAVENEAAETIPETRTRTLFDEPVFWDYAASSNMLQIEVGKLAVEKASTEKTKEMAQEAVEYHEKALKRLERIVRRQDNITLPDSLGSADRGLVQDIALLEGEAFDQRYREFILSTHKAQLNRYGEALAKADNQRIRDWIIDMRTHLRQEVNDLSKLDSVEVASEGL